MSDIVCVSGGFDCLHPGHVALFEAAAQHGPLTVILNSDTWLIEKKGYRVMSWSDRAAVISALRCVSDVVPVDDKDRTITEALYRIRPKYFAKSGDRVEGTMPVGELQACEALGIEVLYNICPHFPYSSSQIIAHIKTNRETTWRGWGHYEVLDEFTHPHPPHWKVKRLHIAPGQRTSYQRHEDRAEHWVVVRGTAEVQSQYATITGTYSTGSYIYIPQHSWHQIINPDTTRPLIIVEVQMGRRCEETDIERHGEPRLSPAPVDFLSLSRILSDA